MIITIGKPCAITEKGGRSNNEDSIYPLPEQVTLDQKLFMVCDGVGGAEKGEVASSLACESIQTFFSTFLKDVPRQSLSIKPYIMRKSVSTPMFKTSGSDGYGYYAHHGLYRFFRNRISSYRR